VNCEQRGCFLYLLHLNSADVAVLFPMNTAPLFLAPRSVLHSSLDAGSFSATVAAAVQEVKHLSYAPAVPCRSTEMGHTHFNDCPLPAYDVQGGLPQEQSFARSAAVRSLAMSPSILAGVQELMPGRAPVLWATKLVTRHPLDVHLWHMDASAGDELPAFHPDHEGCYRDSVTVLLSVENMSPETSLFVVEGSEGHGEERVVGAPGQVRDLVPKRRDPVEVLYPGLIRHSLSPSDCRPSSAQNTTPSQMKMFLTRMGPSSQFIVTGDPSQIDLPTKQASGLPHALQTLTNVEGIAHITLDGRDVVRHPLVRKIIAAYDGQ